MSEKRTEDPINPKLSVICGWFSGAYTLMIVLVPQPSVKIVCGVVAVVMGGFAYLAYRWR